MRFTRYDRWESQLGSVRPISAEHEEDLDGTDTLTLTTFDFVEKGGRLVWRDPNGQWHEHVVDSVQRVHDAGGRAISRVTAINSVCETLGDYIGSLTLTGVTVQAALSAVSSAGGSRWDVASDVAGTYDLSFEDTSVREAISQIIETANAGELRAHVTVGDYGVSHRTIVIAASRGSSTATRRFTYGRNVTGVRRVVESTDPITALYAYGKASEDANGNVARLDISSVNNGVKYVEDTAARDSWGRWNASKTAKVHRFGSYVDENCTDAAFLKAQAQRQLANLSQPEITYEADVIDAEDALRGVSLGDAVDVVDTAFDPPVRMRQRVTRIKRDLMLDTATGTVTIGSRRNYLVRRYVEDAETRKANSKTTSTSSKLETIAGGTGSTVDPTWLSNLTSSLNNDPNYLQGLADALTQGGYLPGGGSGEFPVRNDAANPTVALDDLDASTLQGVSLQADIGGTLQNLMRAYKNDGYGGLLLEVGLACNRLLAINCYSDGADAYVYPPCPPTSTYGDKGYLKLGRSEVMLCGPLHDSLFGAAKPLADLVLGAGGFELNVLSSSVRQVQYGGASISAGDGWVDIHIGSSVMLTLDNTGAGGSVSLSVGNNTLSLDASGVSYNGTVIHS